MPQNLHLPDAPNEVLQSLQHLPPDDGGHWRMEAIIKPLNAEHTRVGLRMVPRHGIAYHLVMIKVDVRAAVVGSRLDWWLRVADWVWFATLPLLALWLYSLVGLVAGDIPLNLYSLSINIAIGGYLWYMLRLSLAHRRRLRIQLQNLTTTEAR